MALNIFHIAVLAITFLYMFNKAEFNQTRLVALVPLCMMFVDVCSVRADFLSVPALAVLMAVLRVTVLVCCAGAMHQDRRMARVRDRKRVKERMVLRTAAITRSAPNVYKLPQYA